MTRTPASSGLRTTLCRDPQAFGALGPEWQGLYRRCGTATPSRPTRGCTPGGCPTARPDGLRLVLVRRGGRLVGAAPLMLAHRPLPVLVPVGGGIPDFCDVLPRGTEKSKRHRRPVPVTNRRLLPATRLLAPVLHLYVMRASGRSRLADVSRARLPAPR